MVEGSWKLLGAFDFKEVASVKILRKIFLRVPYSTFFIPPSPVLTVKAPVLFPHPGLQAPIPAMHSSQ